MLQVYSKTNCTRCDAVKLYLEQNDFPHEVTDVTNDPQMLKLLRDLVPGAGFPVVRFDDGVILGGQVEPIIEKIDQYFAKGVATEDKDDGPFAWWGRGGNINYKKINEDTGGDINVYRHSEKD